MGRTALMYREPKQKAEKQSRAVFNGETTSYLFQDAVEIVMKWTEKGYVIVDAEEAHQGRSILPDFPYNHTSEDKAVIFEILFNKANES